MAVPSTTEQRDSHIIELRGTSYGSSSHTAYWRYFVNVTSNEGASRFQFQSNTDGAGWTDRFSINDDGTLGLKGAVLGDLLYSNATDTIDGFPGNTTTTKKFLTQTGTGAVSAAPAWLPLLSTDLGTVSDSLGGGLVTPLHRASGATACPAGTATCTAGRQNDQHGCFSQAA